MLVLTIYIKYYIIYHRGYRYIYFAESCCVLVVSCLFSLLVWYFLNVFAQLKLIIIQLYIIPFALRYVPCKPFYVIRLYFACNFISKDVTNNMNHNEGTHNAKKNNSSLISSKIEEEKKKHELWVIKKNNRDERIVEYFRILGLGLFGLSLIVLFILLVYCIILYCCKNTIATIVFTVVQFVIGFLSLIVGVWALILTIQANKGSTINSQRNMNINISSANTDVTGITENDVNKDSIAN